MTAGGPPGHAFVSYVHEDSQEVDRLVNFLEAYGVTIWRDREQLWPGDDWRIEIRRAIQDGALAFIACFSDASETRTTSFQNEELVLAAEEYRLRRPGVPWIFPVRFGDVQLPKYDLGAGRTLDSIQRVDLFGDTRENNLARLAAGIARVLGAATPTTFQAPPSSATAAPTRSPIAVVKSLLGDPLKDIELDDYVTRLADAARAECLDTARFPTSSAAFSARDWRAIADEYIERCDAYWQTVAPTCEALLAGCAWGKVGNDALWSRAMRTVANTTPMEGGTSVLLELRTYPRIMALYAGAIGAVARSNYSALRAITMDAKVRDQGRTVPVVGECHIWTPFSGAEVMASVVAMHTDGTLNLDSDLEPLIQGRKGKRKTPVSDDLHARLREPARSLIGDDDEYSGTFDRVEVLLGVIAQDNKHSLEMKGIYAHGGWVGRYRWRGRSGGHAFDLVRAELEEAGIAWAPLQVGLFGGSADRADSAFEALSEHAHKDLM